jgi:hypothetical protein
MIEGFSVLRLWGLGGLILVWCFDLRFTELGLGGLGVFILAPGDDGDEGPGEVLGVEFEAVIVGAVGHVEDVDGAVAFLGGVVEAEFGEGDFAIVVVHFCWVGWGGGGFSEDGGYVDALVDFYGWVHVEALIMVGFGW